MRKNTKKSATTVTLFFYKYKILFFYVKKSFNFVSL